MHIAYRQIENNQYDMIMDIKKITGMNLTRLWEERKNKYKSQEDLARAIDTSTSHMNVMMKGHRGIGPDIMQRLCDELNIEPLELFKREEHSTMEEPIVTDKQLKKIIEIFPNLIQSRKDWVVNIVEDALELSRGGVNWEVENSGRSGAGQRSPKDKRGVKKRNL